MGFGSVAPPFAASVVAVLLALLLLALALPRAWRQLATQPALLPVAASAALSLPVIWRAQAGALLAVDVHLLGVPLVCLMLGPWASVVVVAVACLLDALWRDAAWLQVGANLLLMTLPIASMQAVVQATRRTLPRNIFVFNLGVGMFGVFIAAASAVLLQALVVMALSPPEAAARSAEALPFALLLMWGEGLTSGLIVAILTAYRPQWIASFDDRLYLQPRR